MLASLTLFPGVRNVIKRPKPWYENISHAHTSHWSPINPLYVQWCCRARRVKARHTLDGWKLDSSTFYWRTGSTSLFRNFQTSQWLNAPSTTLPHEWIQKNPYPDSDLTCMWAVKLKRLVQKWDTAIAIWCSKMFHALLSFTGLNQVCHAFLYPLKIEAASYLLEARLRLS